MTGPTCLNLERLAEFTLEHCPNAILWIRDDQIVHANPAACSSLGHTLEQLQAVGLQRCYTLNSEGAEFRWPAELEHGGSVVLECVGCHRDGHTFCVEISATLNNVDGEQLICAMVRTIQQSRQPVDDHLARANEEIQNTIRRLQQSEKRFRSLADTHFDVIITSEDGIVKEVSESFHALSGYAPEEVRGLRLSDILTADSSATVQHRISADEDAVYELRGRRKDGSVVDVEVVGRTVHQDGRKLRISAVRDISGRKQSERDLLASQKRSNLAMEGGRLGTFEWILAEGGGAVSDSFFRLFGRQPGSVTPTYKAFAQHAHPDDLIRLERVFGAALRSGHAIAQEARIHWQDGSMHWIEIRARFAYDATGKAIRLDGVMVDIDQKKAADEKLQKSQLNLSMAMESGNMGTCEWDVRTSIMEQSERAAMITGWRIDGEPVSFRRWMEQIHPGDRRHVFKDMQHARRNKGDVAIEYRQKDASGRYRWLEARGRFAYDADDTATRVCGVIVNIDHRKQAEEEIKLRRFAVDVAAEAMFTIRIDGSIIDVNQTACDRLGYTRNELLQLEVSDFAKLPVETFAEHVAALRKRTSRVVRTVHRRKDGSTFDVEVSARLFDYEGQEYICATARDVSELRTAEAKTRELDQQLAHMNRLGSMGEMASAIAHELNQPLYVISNLATLLQYNSQLTDTADDEAVEMMETICSQAILAGDIVRRMRGFCLNKPSTRTVTDLTELITESLRLLEPKFRHSSVKTDVEFNEIQPAMIDRVQIQQVLVNLIQNAIEAMENIPEQNRYLNIRTQQHSDTMIRVSVTDQGPGVTVPQRKKLFEPFFSTKTHGMGMGLAISCSIIEAHNGQLTMTETYNGLTTFHMDLPYRQRQAVTV